MEDNKLIVNLTDGDKKVIEVIEIIQDKETGKEYVFYNLEGNDDEVYMSELVETEDTCTLKDIKDEKMVKQLEDYILELAQEVDKEGE